MSLSTMKQDSYIKSLEWILYICFCCLSAFLMWGVLDKFISGKTNFTNSEEPLKELPTITLCFSNSDSTKTVYEYGQDFKIEYHFYTKDDKTSLLLIEGKNLTIFDEFVSLNKVISSKMGNCYKFSHVFNNPTIYQYSAFFIYFNKSYVLDDTLKLKLFFTSEKNAFGSTIKKWKDGNVAKIKIDKGFKKVIDVLPKKFIHLPGQSNCGHESYYECFGRIQATINESSIKCFPGSQPYLPVCKESDINKEYWENFWLVWNNVSQNGQCPKLCSTICYTAETTDIVEVKKYGECGINATFGFGFTFDSTNSMTLVFEEYLIYDLTSMIGSVGGTLGMCMGFSFTGVVSRVAILLKNGIGYIKDKWKTRDSQLNDNSISV